MKKIILMAAVALMALTTVTSCGGRSDQEKIVEFQNSQLTEALRAHDLGAAEELADSMALYVDDLTPDETVMVLMAFLEVHNSADPKSDADLETLRKYVDVYDIAVGANPNDMRAAFAAARRLNPALDFEKAAADFRRALAEYDAVQTYGETVEEAAPAKPDSTTTAAADSVATSANASLSVD